MQWWLADEMRDLSYKSRDEKFETDMNKLMEKIAAAAMRGQFEVVCDFYLRPPLCNALTNLGYDIGHKVLNGAEKEIWTIGWRRISEDG